MRASTLLSVLFLGAGALGSLEARQTANVTVTLHDDLGPTPTSLIQILQTGIPSSVLTNPAVQSTVKSQIAAGHPPSWFTALPTAVQSFLRQAGTADSEYFSSATGTGARGAATATGASGVKPTSSNAATKPTGAAILGAIGLAGVIIGL